MNREQLIELLADSAVDDVEDLLLADGFEDACVGVVERCGQPAHLVYDRDKCVEILVERDGMRPDEAEEFLQFNVVSAWVGPNTPGFLRRIK